MSRESERGSVSIVAASVTCLVLLLVMLCADLARILVWASQAQSAADAAALAAAGALALPGDRGPAEVAGEYATANGARLESCDCPPGSQVAQVTVALDGQDLLLLEPLASLRAQARATVGAYDPEPVGTSP